MRPVVILCLLACFSTWAGTKQRGWQEAHVAKIGYSVSETEQAEYTPSPGTGVAASGVETRRTRIWTYVFQTDHQVYTARLEGKPLAGLHEGDRIQIAVQRGVLRVLGSRGKERTLELLK